ncbi:hypothetical protein LBMAG52_39970 [Planctomycetia bacterium]|nr:hypothetical protein LBMAG52_39970 [Planctomycetia bacterium]
MARELFWLSDRTRVLLMQHYDFYLALASGARRPTTDAQQHFVAVCRGKAEPVTDHERAFLDFKKLVSLSRMTAKQVVECRFSVEVPASDEVPNVNPSESPSTASADSQSASNLGEIDEYGEGIPRPGWFSDDGWRRMRSGYRFDSRD